MKEEFQEELNVPGNPGGEGSTEEKARVDLARSRRYAEMETEIISMIYHSRRKPRVAHPIIGMN